jgi:hypothetical protein
MILCFYVNRGRLYDFLQKVEMLAQVVDGEKV